MPRPRRCARAAGSPRRPWRAAGPPPGPVHVNARFRKPLEPVEADGPEAWEPLVDALIARGPPARRRADAVPPIEDAIVAIATRRRRGASAA